MVCHAEASSKLQKRPIRSVSILSLDNCWGSSALMEDFPGAAQRRSGLWLWLAAGVWGKMPHAGPDWGRMLSSSPLDV